jgi:hypothetical protein
VVTLIVDEEEEEVELEGGWACWTASRRVSVLVETWPALSAAAATERCAAKLGS